MGLSHLPPKEVAEVEQGIHLNLGPRDKVAEKMAEWLAEIDFGERL
jgi:hypothetical protein